MKSKILHCTFYFLFVSSLAYSQSPVKLLQALAQSKPDTNKVRILLNLGDHYAVNYFNQATPDYIKKALNYYSQARDLSKSLGNRELLDLSLMCVADCDIANKNTGQGESIYKQVISDYQQHRELKQEAFAWGKFGSKMPYHDIAQNKIGQEAIRSSITLYKRLHDQANEASQVRNLALYHTYAGQLDLAEADLLQALELYKATGNTKLYPVFDDLSRVYKTKGNLSKQLYYLLAMVNNLEAYGTQAEKAYYYYIIAGFYRDWGNYDQDLTWIQKAVANEDKYHDNNLHFNLTKQLVEVLLLKKENQAALLFLKNSVKNRPPEDNDDKYQINECFGNCYLALGQLKEAERYYLMSLANYQTAFQLNYSPYEDVWIHQDLGDCYFLLGQFKTSAAYFAQIPPAAFQSVKPAVLSKLYLSMFRTDSALNNYLPAIQHYQQYKKISDSLFNISKSGQIAEMQTKYETTQKEQSIRLLKSESKNEHEQMKTLNLERNITFAGIAMLLSTGGIAYRGYRIKQRSNVQLRAKQQEINRQNLALQLLVEEKDGLLVEKDDLLHQKDSLIGDKDWLLKEVHHRVKNNLQIVMSLLNTQSAFLENLDAISALRESQNRVQSISLIHQKLYMSDKAASINMRAYISDLLLYLTDSYGTGKRRIRFVQTVDDITIDISQAVPLGLILNEAITNAIKYAFEPAGGEIIICFRRSGDDTLMLTIADNGRGIPEALIMGKKTSLGMKMMRILSKQLNGNYTITNTSGVIISLEFPEDKLMHSLHRQKVYQN
jgi:two-component sensor histidine kinase